MSLLRSTYPRYAWFLPAPVNPRLGSHSRAQAAGIVDTTGGGLPEGICFLMRVISPWHGPVTDGTVDTEPVSVPRRCSGSSANQFPSDPSISRARTMSRQNCGCRQSLDENRLTHPMQADGISRLKAHFSR